MKQLILHLRSGETALLDVPRPKVGPHQLLIRTERSITSPGTEHMLLNFGKGNWIQKARQQPERLSDVIAKIRTDGMAATWRSVKSKLDLPTPLGYCNAGVVLAVGAQVSGYSVGDRVASNGAHAELALVSAHLAAKIPDGVSFDQAVFTVPGAIALQSIRLLNPTLGETFAVVGLGLIGQMTVRLLRAAGCRVVASDPNASRRALADFSGVFLHDPSVQTLASFCAGIRPTGIDGVVIAAATDNEDLLHSCAHACRKRGRIVVSGVAPLKARRTDFFAKELSLQVSSSYGPGRYDPVYENKGKDYPEAFIRWTAQRNFEAVLEALADGSLNISGLLPAPVPFETSATTYHNPLPPGQVTTLFTYSAHEQSGERATFQQQSGSNGAAFALIGAGQFANAILLPALQKAGVKLAAVCSRSGLHAAAAAKKFAIPKVTADAEELITDPTIGTVLIATQHHTHADLTALALKNGKHVFVEKPLAIHPDELTLLHEVLDEHPDLVLHVGYNRRFAPLAQKAKSMLDERSPMHLQITVNAGMLPSGHWAADPQTGGGRLIGELCHFLDLAQFFTASLIQDVSAIPVGTLQSESASVLLKMNNSSAVTINYLTNGAPQYDKERIEIFQGGKILILENWRTLRGYGIQNFRRKSLRQDKGHDAQISNFVAAIKKHTPLISRKELLNSASAAFAVVESLKDGVWKKPAIY